MTPVNRKIVIWSVILVGVMLVAIAIAASLSGGDSDSIYVVQESDFIRTVSAEGNLRAAEATPVSAPRDAPGGLRIAWLLKDGAPIKKGDVLIRFDPTEFRNDLIEAGVERQTIDNSTAAASGQARATRENLLRDASQAQLEYETAQGFQIQDVDIFSRHEVIESMIDSDLALEKKEYAEDVLDVRESLNQADRELLEIEKRNAMLRYTKAEKGLSALEVIAPHDGIVTFQRDWRGELPTVGSTVFPGRPIAELPNLETMEAEVFVLEADAGGIEQGQRAEVRLESAPGRVIGATVKRIDAVPRPRLRGVPVQYFGVVLELDETVQELMKPGARVSATIILDELENVITIPRQAVFEREGERVVYVDRGGHFEEVVVETGSSSLGRVVVTGGLATGDRIALKRPTENGTNGS